MTHAPTPCVAIVPLFAGLTASEQEAVAARARTIRRRRGELVRAAGDPAAPLVVVHRGRLKVSAVTASGTERLLRVLEPGDFTGESAFLSGSPSLTQVSALTDVEVCALDHADLAALVARHPDIAVRMLQTVSARLDDAERRIFELTSSDVEQRLAAYLVDLPATRAGADAVPTVRLPLPKKDVASLLGTTPETLSRRLAAFAEGGLIALGDGTVEIRDATGLQAIADR